MSGIEDYRQIERYVLSMWRSGRLTKAEFDIVLGEFTKVASAAGGIVNGDDPSLVPIISQATFLMKKKLLEIHPEMATELRELETSRRRR